MNHTFFFCLPVLLSLTHSLSLTLTHICQMRTGIMWKPVKAILRKYIWIILILKIYLMDTGIRVLDNTKCELKYKIILLKSILMTSQKCHLSIPMECLVIASLSHETVCRTDNVTTHNIRHISTFWRLKI